MPPPQDRWTERYRPPPRRVRERGIEVVLGIVAGLVPAVVIGLLLLGGGSAPESTAIPSSAAFASPASSSAPGAATATSPPLPSATSLPTPAPTDPPEPTKRPAPVRTDPPVTLPPTPDEPDPTEPPVAAEAGGGPARAVRRFYDAVELHNWTTAIALWSPAMQERYPPDAWLIDRFRRTTRIDILELDTLFVDRGAGTARVAVTLVEYRTVEPSPRTFVGAWDLVRIDGVWVLNAPYF